MGHRGEIFGQKVKARSINWSGWQPHTGSFGLTQAHACSHAAAPGPLPTTPVRAFSLSEALHTPKSSRAHTPSVACLGSPAMAPCVAPLLAFSLVLLWTFPAPALGGANDAEDCCLSVTQRPIPGNIVKAFRYLLIQDGCRVPAVVLTTLRGYQLCAPPDQPWVDRIIRRLKNRRSIG